MKGGKRVIAAVAAGLLLWSYFLFALLMRAEKSRPPSFEYAQLQENIDRLERLVALEKVEIERVRKKAEVEAKENERILRDLAGRGRAEAAAQLRPGDVNAFGPWKQPIAVLVFACNRPLAVRNHLDLLIKYRPSAELFPIIVSQDCDNQEVADAVKSYGNQVSYIKHLSGEKANITVSPAHLRYIAYYRIARHYKLALSHVFDTANYGSVIVTEDDLSVAVDFFEYFSATRHLLELDQSLYCVSAWNDNGKKEAIDMSAAGSRLLYRSDFFPGLGWMMTKRLWTELGPIWPAGFWDDWIRDPLRRKDRGCIRPEISRTGMTKHGKSGASKGLFFSKHLARVELNQHYVNFTQIDLQYLLKENYDPWFQKEVYESPLLSINEVFTADLAGKAEKCRVEYISLQSYMIFADRLHVMHDFKAGVGRTAYQGVVSCFVGGRRIYLARDRRVITNYDPAWEAPAVPGE